MFYVLLKLKIKSYIPTKRYITIFEKLFENNSII